MGKIPEFSRVVLPNRSVGSAGVQASRAQYDINAQQIGQNRRAQTALQNDILDYKIREAEAKNATWVNEKAVEYKKEMAEATEAKRQERAGNPDNFHRDFDREMIERGSKILKEAPSSAAREALGTTLSEMRAGQYTNNLSWERQRTAAMFAESIDKTASNLKTMALRRGQSGEDIDDLLNDADASAIAGSTIVSGPEKVDRIKTTIRRGVISDYLEGMAENDPSRVKEILKSGKYDKDLDADSIQRLDSVADAELKRAQAETRAELGEDIGDVEQAAKMGLKVPEEKLRDLITKSEAADLPKQANKLRKYIEIQDEVSGFAAMSIDEQRRSLDTLKASIESGNTSEVDKYGAMSQVFKTKIETVKKDPYSYYAAHDVIREPEQIDFTQPQNMAYELDQRRISVQQVKELDGLTMPLMTPQEISQLKDIYDATDPRQAANLLTTLNQAMSPQEISAVAQAMAPKSKTLSVAIATGDPQVGEMIIRGAAAKGEVTAADLRDSVNKKIGGAIIDPTKLEPIQEAIYAYYKQSSLMAGDTEESIDSDRLDQSIEAIMGPVLEIDTKFGFGGVSKVLSYRDRETNAWKDEDDLNDILMGITDDQLEELNGTPQSPDGRLWKAEDILRSARFVTAGDGVYAAIVDGLGYVSKADGTPYLIDARRLEQIQGGR